MKSNQINLENLPKNVFIQNNFMELTRVAGKALHWIKTYTLADITGIMD